MIAEDHPIFRSALESLLADHDDVEVVGTVGTGQDLVELVRNSSRLRGEVGSRSPGMMPG